MGREVEDMTDEVVDEDSQKKFEEACDNLPDYFDEEEFVTENILPLWSQIHSLCAERAIPVVFTVCYANTEKTASSDSGMVVPGKRSPDYIHRIASMLNNGGEEGGIHFTQEELFEAVKGLKSLGRISRAFG